MVAGLSALLALLVVAGVVRWAVSPRATGVAWVPGRAPGTPSAPPASPERVVVRVESDPPGAEVYRDGVVLGVTPCDVRVPSGTQTIELSRSGSRRKSLAIEAQEGARYVVHLLPEPPAPLPAEPSVTGTEPRPVHPLRKKGVRPAVAKTLNPFH